MNIQTIGEEHAKLILNHIREKDFPYTYEQRSHQMVFEEAHQELLRFRLPISLTSPEAYYTSPQDRANYVLILIRSGLAAVGYFENGENMDHKVFRAYMVRKKQGKSQIKHLKTKGKSRAGSRVRLGETLEFFENINERLQHYFKTYRVDRIGISCATTLIPFFYGSKNPPPFEKGDDRILKIPKHVQQPTYEALLDTNAFLLKGELKYHESGISLFNNWMALNKPNAENEDLEDW